MNRNKLMVLNGVVVFVMMIANAVLGMVEISLFISKYGPSINGLIQTGNQVLSYLSLIEAGISAAFLYKMYEPLAKGKKDELSGLYTGFQKSMSQTVIKMLVISILICMIYPLFINTGTSYLLMVAIFILLSLKVILPYKVTMVPKYMLIVKEQKYKAEFISGFCRILTYSIEIMLLKYFNFPLLVVLSVGVVIALLSGLIFKYVMNSVYRDTLDLTATPNHAPKKMSKDILAHNLSAMVFNSTDNIIISAFGSLSMVTIYSSYNMVLGQVVELATKFLDGATASFGIKIANKDTNSYGLYREMLSSGYWMSTIITSVFFVMINDFVYLWIGDRFILNKFDVALFTIIMLCGIVSPCIQVVRNASGLYKESRDFTIMQSVLNLVLSIILVPKMGITGALIGTTIARVVITMPFNYSLVAKSVFPEFKSKSYELIIVPILLFVMIGIEEIVVGQVIPSFDHSLQTFMIKLVVVSSMSVIFSTGFFYLLNTGFREFCQRIISLIKKS